jgi:outer membrane protein
LKKFIFFALIPLLLYAQNPNEIKNEEKLDLSLGLASFYKESIYRQNSSRVVVFPNIDLDYYGLYIKGTQLGYNIDLGDGVHLSPTLTYKFDGYDNDGDYLDGMDKRKDAIYGGARLSYSFEGHTLYGSYSHDISGVNNGGFSTLGYRYFHLSYPYAFSPGLSASYSDERYSDYYYGVKRSEALSGRPYYDPGSTTNATASMLGMYHINKKAYIFGLVNYDLYEDSIKDSPIVNKRGAFGVAIGFAYKIY